MSKFDSEQRFQQVMQDHTEYLLRLAFLYLKDWSAAEDVVQDVFLKFYQSHEQFEERSSVKTYLAKMTINKCKDYLKSWRYKKHVLTNQFLHPTVKNRNRFVEADERLELADAVLELSINYREVIIHYYYDELSIIQVAEILSISQNTVKTRLRKARALLKEKIHATEWEVLLHE